MTESGGIVTILFTDVVNSTDVLSRLGDVRAEELRRSHFNDLREVIAENSGREVKTMGDGFMVVFASAVDALHCAAGMQQVAAGAGVGLRVGIHVGEPMREGDDYFGTPVVVASRLCDTASSGQILTSDLVHALVGSRGDFTFHDAGFLALKGLEEPVAGWEVSWDRPTTEVLALPAQLTAGERLPFVGRDDLLDELRLQWKKARDGHRALVMLAGEPGIGKTRLAAEFARECHDDGAIALFGHADEEILLPYQPFVEALQHVVRSAPEESLTRFVGDNGAELARLLPALRDHMPGLDEPMRSDADSERFRLFEATTEFLGELTAVAPVVLVLDDLHWADRPTLLLLLHLFRATTDMGILVVGTYRDTDLDRRHPLAETLADLRRLVQFERLSLAGMREDDLNTFIDLVTGREPPPGFARAILDQTEGNPFFTGEVLRHLVESGTVSVVDGEWITQGVEHLGIPEGVTEVIGRRLSRLSDDANTALAVAAVAGRDFDLDVIERVTEFAEEQLLAALDEAVTARLVVEVQGAVNRFHFAHALVRETLYDELTTARRVRLHRKIAQALEELHSRDPDAALSQLAYHWFESASAADVARAVDYSRRAGAAALVQLAYEESVGHFERALQALDLAELDDASLRCDVLLALADAQERAGDADAGRTTYERAGSLARQLSDAERFGRAALGIAGNPQPGESRPEMIALLDEAHALFDGADEPTHARVMARFGMELYFLQERSRLVPLLEGALEMARRTGDAAATGYALTMAFWMYDGLERVDARLAMGTEAVEIGTQTNDVEVEHWGRAFRAYALLEVGDLAGFRVELEALEQLVAKVKLPSIAWYPPMWRAALATAEGRIADSEALAIEAVSIAQRSDDLTAMQMFGVQLFAIRAEQGRMTEVEASVRSMVESFPLIPAWRLGLATLLAETGRPEEARRELAVVTPDGRLDLPRDANWSTAVALIAYTSFLLETDDFTADIYRELLPLEHRFVVIGQSADWYGSVARSLGELAAVRADYDAAVAHFERAIEADGGRGATRMKLRGSWALARTLLRRGATGDRDRAASVVAESLPQAEQLGLVVLAERLRSLGV